MDGVWYTMSAYVTGWTDAHEELTDPEGETRGGNGWMDLLRSKRLCVQSTIEERKFGSEWSPSPPVRL